MIQSMPCYLQRVEHRDGEEKPTRVDGPRAVLLGFTQSARKVQIAVGDPSIPVVPIPETYGIVMMDDGQINLHPAELIRVQMAPEFQDLPLEQTQVPN